MGTIEQPGFQSSFARVSKLRTRGGKQNPGCWSGRLLQAIRQRVAAAHVHSVRNPVQRLRRLALQPPRDLLLADGVGLRASAVAEGTAGERLRVEQ